jgi:hypothetical protein
MLKFNKGLKFSFCIFSKYPEYRKRVNMIKKLKSLEKIILYSEKPILLYITAAPIRNHTKVLDFVIQEHSKKLLFNSDNKKQIENKSMLLENDELKKNLEISEIAQKKEEENDHDKVDEADECLLNYYEPDDLKKTQEIFGIKKLPCLFLFNNAEIIDCKIKSCSRRSR